MKIKPIVFKGVNKNTLDYKSMSDNILSPSYKKTENNGRIACYLSHINILINFLKDKSTTSGRAPKSCFIFEDDIKLNEKLSNTVTVIKNIMKDVPSEWDIIYFGKCAEFCDRKVIVNEYITTGSNPLCLHAYAVSRKGAEKILEKAFPITQGVDHMYRKLANTEFIKEYTSIDSLFLQNRDNFGSSIGHGKLIETCSKSYNIATSDRAPTL